MNSKDSKEKQNQYEKHETEGVSVWKVGEVKWAQTSIILYGLSQEPDSSEDLTHNNQKNQATS